jgi:hypothetical protein
MSFTQTFPNGMTLTSSALAVNDINGIFQKLTCQILGFMIEQPFATSIQQGNPVVQIATNSGIGKDFAVTDVLDAFGIAAYGQSNYGGSSVIPDGTVVINVNETTGAITLSNSPTGTVANATLYFTSPLADNSVRLTFPTTGQPSYSVNDNLCFITCKEVDDWYNKVPDEGTQPIDGNNTAVTLLKEYTRVWRVFWEVRGPGSTINATLLKTAMQFEFMRATLAAFGLYLVPDVGNPQRVPEQWGEQWYERVDLAMHFNEQVNESIVVPTVASVEVKTFNAQGMQSDLVIGE